MNEARQSQIMPFVPMYKVIKCSNFGILVIISPDLVRVLQRSVCYRVARASETPSNFVYLFVVFFSYQTIDLKFILFIGNSSLLCVYK